MRRHRSRTRFRQRDLTPGRLWHWGEDGVDVRRDTGLDARLAASRGVTRPAGCQIPPAAGFSVRSPTDARKKSRFIRAMVSIEISLGQAS